MRIPLWFKLPFAFALVLAVSLTSAWYAIGGVRDIEALSERELRKDNVPALESMAQIGLLVGLIQSDFWRHHAFVTDPSAAQIAQAINDQATALQAELSEYGQTLSNEIDRQQFAELQTLVQGFLAPLREAMAKDSAGDSAGFHALAGQIATQFNTKLKPHLELMVTTNRQSATQACDDTVTLTRSVEHGATLGAAAAVGLGALIAVLLCLHILVPLARCRRAVAAMALGRVASDDGSAGILRRGDELGDIARATHSMAGYLRDMAGTAQSIAAGNLVVTVTPRGSDDALGTSFQTMHGNLTNDIRMLSLNTKTLAASAQELTEVSAQMAVSTEESSQQAAEVSSAGEQVHQSITSVAGAMEEMDASVKGIATSTQQMADQVTGAAKVADQLAAASSEVEQIVKTVQSTADRTNLLALNATIEAASAGEAGRGFAVVANEVKELAKQSLAAAEQANRILSQMRTHAIQVNTLTRTASQTVLTVASAVEEQSATVNDISRNMGEAAKAAAQIASSINEIATAGRDTANGVSQVKDAADDMAKQTSQINSMVERFKLPA